MNSICECKFMTNDKNTYLWTEVAARNLHSYTDAATALQHNISLMDGDVEISIATLRYCLPPSETIIDVLNMSLLSPSHLR